MPRDPLDTVLKLRQRAVDEGRLALSRAVAAEALAEAEARAAADAIMQEERRAADPEGGDDLVEAFAAWLPGANERVKLTRAEQERLAVEVDCRRAELAASRTGLEVIETLLRQTRDAAANRQAHQLQRAIDEAAARRQAGP